MSNSRSWAAFTLVEVLLALALTATVLTLVARIAVQSLNLTKAIDQQIDTRHKQTYWAERLDLDMASAIERGRLITADLDAHGRPRIRIMAVTADAGAEDAATQTPTEVTYRVLTHEDHLRLVRETRSLLRAQPITHDESMGCGMESIEVELWIDGEWQAAEHGDDDGRRQAPEAIQVEIHWWDAERPVERIWRLRDKSDRSQRRDR